MASDLEALMQRVGAVAQAFELESIRFVRCEFAYEEVPENSEIPIELGIKDQCVSLDDSVLTVGMTFEMVAPSPFEDAHGRRVTVRGQISITYERQPDAEVSSQENIDAFGRVNGIYNAWPYIREYVQSSLVRLGLPAFDLPLLRAGGAAQLAGFLSSEEQGSGPGDSSGASAHGEE